MSVEGHTESVVGVKGVENQQIEMRWIKAMKLAAVILRSIWTQRCRWVGRAQVERLCWPSCAASSCVEGRRRGGGWCSPGRGCLERTCWTLPIAWRKEAGRERRVPAGGSCAGAPHLRGEACMGEGTWRVKFDLVNGEIKLMNKSLGHVPPSLTLAPINHGTLHCITDPL